jgi:hypothetical protein
VAGNIVVGLAMAESVNDDLDSDFVRDLVGLIYIYNTMLKLLGALIEGVKSREVIGLKIGKVVDKVSDSIAGLINSREDKVV